MKTKNTYLIMKMYHSISQASPKRIHSIKKKGFTLVELIIVITILAILATIAFISFKNYSGNARDGNRVSTLKNIETGLGVYFVKTGEYPMPEGNILTGSINGKEIIYSGEIGENISRSIKLNKVSVDPVLGKNYKYGITYNKQEYNLGGIGESDSISQKIIPITYADNYFGQVVGNYKGYIKYSTGSYHYLTNAPSLIFTYSGSINNLEDIFLEKEKVHFIIKKGENIPYEVSGKINSQNPDEVIKKKTGKPNAQFENLDISEVVSASSDTEKKTKIQELLNNQENEHILDSFGSDNEEMFENIVNGGIPQTTSNNSSSSSSSSGGGNLPSQNNCLANPSFEKDGKIFNVPELTNGSSANPKPYIDVVENNGTFRYELTVTCTDSILDGSVSSPQGQFCDYGYVLNETGISCIPKKCDAVIIDGYNIPILNHGASNVNITKILSITGGNQTWVGKFSCNFGTVTSISSQPVNLVCNAGYYKTDISTCTITSKGYYSLSGATTQTVCGNGKYQDEVGQGSCKTCTNKIENSTYILSSALIANICPWSCAPGYGYNGTSCVPATQCISGLEYITIGNGQSWACKNVGATSVWNGIDSFTCTSSTDCSNKPPYAGNYYQWGKDNTSWTIGQSAQPYYYGWEPTNNTRWGSSNSDLFWGNGGGTTSIGRKGACDDGWHIPSAYEWYEMCKTLGNTSDCANTSATKTAIQSALKFPYTGLRAWDTGNYGYVNDTAYYWGSSPYYDDGVRLAILKNSETIGIGPSYRAFSMQIRCMKNNW